MGSGVGSGETPGPTAGKEEVTADRHLPGAGDFMGCGGRVSSWRRTCRVKATNRCMNNTEHRPLLVWRTTAQLRPRNSQFVFCVHRFYSNSRNYHFPSETGNTGNTF